MLKRKNNRRKTAGLQSAETVEPRIVLSAIQPIAVADADSAEIDTKATKASQQQDEKAQVETTTSALSGVNKAVVESAGKEAVAPVQLDPALDVKVADHLHQNDFAAQEMINGKEMLGNLKGGLDPEMETSPGDLSGRNQVGQDSNDEMTFTLDDYDEGSDQNDVDDALFEAEAYLIMSGEVETDEDKAQRLAEEAERAAEEAAKQAESMVKMPTPDEAGGGSDGDGEPTPDRDDLTPGVGDPSEDDEDSGGPVAEIGNVDVGNTNWGEGNDGPAGKDAPLDPVVQHVIDVYFETLGGKINPLPVK